jgi:hypothetical protein
MQRISRIILYILLILVKFAPTAMRTSPSLVFPGIWQGKTEMGKGKTLCFVLNAERKFQKTSTFVPNAEMPQLKRKTLRQKPKRQPPKQAAMD